MIQLPFDLEPVVVQSLYSKTDVEKGLHEFFHECLPKADGIDVYHGLANTKILLGSICVAIGCYGQFSLKMPEDRQVLGIVVFFYFVVSGIAWALDKFYMSKGFITEFLYKDGGPIRLHVALDDFSDNVCLTLCQGQKTESSNKSCGKLFSEDGNLDQKALFDEFNYVLHALVKKKGN